MSLLNDEHVMLACNNYRTHIDEPPEWQSNLDPKGTLDLEETIRDFAFLLTTVPGSSFDTSGIPRYVKYETGYALSAGLHDILWATKRHPGQSI